MKLLIILFSCCLAFLGADEQIMDLGTHGSVRYTSDKGRLTKVERLSSLAELLYVHYYHYDEHGMLVCESFENGLGKAVYVNDLAIEDPFENYEEAGERPCTEYDGFGNLTRVEDKEFIYDDDNRLVRVITPQHEINYMYDSSGKRIARTINGNIEYYIYLGINEMAILGEGGNVLEFRIPGLSSHEDILRPIAIETAEAIYAPIHDSRGTITQLIDISTGEDSLLAKIDPFGRGLDQNVPVSWLFAGKTYDKEANLVYFGKRYYSPELKQWLTPDPLQQTADPYQYCLGDPLSYFDPNGEWAISLVNIAWGAGATITAPIWGPYALAAVAGAALGYTGYKVYEHYNDDTKLEARKEKEGKQKDGAPESREAQQKQAGDAKREIERKIGRKLTKAEEREFHDNVTKQDYSYNELVEEGLWLFNGN